MAITSCVRWRVVGLIAAGAAVAHAQTAPPIKAGLWQVSSEHLIDGQKLPDALQQLQALPPEARQQMEAMMKQRGLDVSAGAGTTRICISAESLDEGRWHSDHSGCKTEYSSRTASLWKWRSVCTRPASDSEGEARIHSAERYTVKLRSKVAQSGKTATTDVTMNAKWLGADCGSVKPATAPTTAPTKPARP